MKRATLFFVLFTIIFIQKTYSQKESWNWVIWGNTQISFNNKDTVPQLISGSRLTFGWMMPATISDKNGNLLFYSGSELNSGGRCNIPGAVYNKYNEEIESSVFNNFTACSHNQYILPYPGKLNVFYLIKTNRTLNNKGLISFVYDVIDMNKNNGHGKVIKKDTSIGYVDKHYDNAIMNGTLFNHNNKIESWFIALQDTSNNSWIYSYLFSSNKVKDTVINTIRHRYYSHILKRANNDKEFSICYEEDYSPNYIYPKSFIAMFSFDNNTGKIKEKKIINICDSCQIHGIEYSPDNSKLFIGAFQQIKADSINNIFEWNSTILVYDFALNKSKQIFSEKYLKNEAPIGLGSYTDLKLAPNRKIYFIDTKSPSSLFSIDNPNAPLNEIKVSEIKNFIQDTSMRHYDFLPIFLPNYYNVNVLAQSNTPICENETLVLNADISDTTYPRSYEWRGPDGFNSTLKSPILNNIKSKNAGWYILKATVNGAELWDSIYVTVKPLAKPDITGLNKVYEAETKVYKTPQANKSNKWSVTGGEILGYNTLDSVIIKWGSIGVGKVILEQAGSEFDCKGYNEFEVTIEDWSGNVINGKNIVCEDDSVKYTAFSSQNITNNWYVTNGIVLNKTNEELYVNWKMPGNGIVKNIRNNSLTNKTDSSELNVIINPKPDKPVITDNGNNNLQTEESYLCQWYLNGELIHGETSYYLKAKQSGKYQVIVIDTNGCKSELSEPFDFTVGVAEYSENKTLSPNPASDCIEINMPPLPPGEGWGEGIRIIDLLGVEITTLALRATPPYQGGEIVRIDVSSLQPGVYFVCVGNEVRKFVKM